MKKKTEEQRRHDDYVAKLTEVTDKPLTEMTLEEFRWLAGRFVVPLGETPQSRLRRKFVGSLVDDESMELYTRLSEGGPMLSISDLVDAAFRKALANNTTWPVLSIRTSHDGPWSDEEQLDQSGSTTEEHES